MTPDLAELAAELPDGALLTDPDRMFAYGTGQEGDWPRAQQLFGESVQRFRDLGDDYYALRAARAHVIIG